MCEGTNFGLTNSNPQDDPVLQSLPLAYVALEAASNDGQTHLVQVYMDIGGGAFLTRRHTTCANVALRLADG